jgi:hypothetical protein
MLHPGLLVCDLIGSRCSWRVLDVMCHRCALIDVTLVVSTTASMPFLQLPEGQCGQFPTVWRLSSIGGTQSTSIGGIGGIGGTHRRHRRTTPVGALVGTWALD